MHETTEHKLYMRWKQVGATLRELRERPDTDPIILSLVVEAEAKLSLAFSHEKGLLEAGLKKESKKWQR